MNTKGFRDSVLCIILATVILLGSLTSNVSAAWYWKLGYPNYAPNGVPDFDQRQDMWDWPLGSGTWTYCGPVAVANSLWWLDSKFDPSRLVESYGPWGDHDALNVQPLVSDLAWAMDTDAQRTGPRGSWIGTYPADMENAIDTWLVVRGLSTSFYRKSIYQPTFAQVVEEVKASEDVILLLGFWVLDGQWVRIGGHFVTVAGVDSENSLIAFSDPIKDIAAPGLPSHNDAQYVSHDIYTAVPTASPGGTWGPGGYATAADARAFFGANPTPMIERDPELQAQLSDLPYLEQQQIATEVEYAVVVSPTGGTVEIGYDDGIVDGWSWWTGPGGMFAVRFSPAVSGLLKTVRFYIYSSPATIRVHIMDQSRADIVPSFLQTPSATGWFDVDVLAKGVSVTSGVDFYVAAEWTVANAPTLGADTSSPDGRSWKFNGVTWSLVTDRDYMIRAVIQQSAPPPPTTPLSTASTAIINAPAWTDYYIYPATAQTGGVKDPHVIYALATDWSATGFIGGMSANTQNIGLDSNGLLCSTVNGQPRSDVMVAGSGIVIVSGPVVHAAVHYYEFHGTGADKAPVYFAYDPTNFYFKRSKDGSVLASMPSAQVGGSSDIFLIEIFTDSNGRVLLIMYGFAYLGTLAASTYFKFVIAPSLATYTDSYYVFRWTDASAGVSANGIPDMGDTYALLISGS